MGSLPESLQEIADVLLTWTFVPLALAVLLAVVVGGGWWRTRWRRAAWLAGAVLVGTALYLGVARHEWGEVLFNGQLL